MLRDFPDLTVNQSAGQERQHHRPEVSSSTLLHGRLLHSTSRHPLSALHCTFKTAAMASVMRPGLMRQAFQKPATSQRMLSTLTASTINRPLAQQLRPAFQRSAIPNSTRIAAFHATQRKEILPPLPQKIVGTTNDPTPVPNPDYAHGSYHWSFERCVTPPFK